jgi:hypothetical protein
VFEPGVQVTEQLLLVPLPLSKVQLVVIPLGRVPLKVTLPVGSVLNEESPSVTVTVQVSDVPTTPVYGVQLREVIEVVVSTTKLPVPELA